MFGVKKQIIKSLEEASGLKRAVLEIPENRSFGDYSTNLAMRISQKEENPRELALKVVEKLGKDKVLTGLVEKIDVAGPGFINFWIKKEVLFEEALKILEERQNYASLGLGKGKTVVIDYSAPNIAKRFSIGHLRSTIIGQALYNLYEHLGYRVVGDNHLGDWGTQFGVILAAIEEENLDPAELTIADLERLYVEFHQKEQEDPSLHDKAKEWFKKLEEGDKKAGEFLKKIIDLSMEEFNKIYDLLGVKIDYAYGESFYQDKMPGVIRELREKKLTKKSEGAEIIEFENMPPAMIVKSDGTTTYFTRDLATIKFRLENWDPDIFIYEVGSEQTLHFRQLFESARMLGWVKEKELKHVAHGLYLSPEGKKFSTRKGKSIKLEEVLDEAVKKAVKIIEKSETSRNLSEAEKKDVSLKVGIGAIKYNDLMHHPSSDIVFDWEKVFVLEGNSAPYLQYTAARAGSVLDKAEAGYKNGELKEPVFNKEEESLLRMVVKFGDYIEKSAFSYSPNLLCSYLFELSQTFNTFYNKYRIVGERQERQRVVLTGAVREVLENGLLLLGIQTPERM